MHTSKITSIYWHLTFRIRVARALSSDGRKRRRCGYTLIELAIVIAIIGILAAIAIPGYVDYRDKVRVSRTIAEVRMMEREITMYHDEIDQYPDSLGDIGRGTLLDPWGHPYQYLKIAGMGKKGGGGKDDSEKGKDGKDDKEKDGGVEGKMRKDRFLVPLNSDYDLYSMGKDGDSRAPLTAQMSRDDIVRASDGAFVGLASDF